ELFPAVPAAWRDDKLAEKWRKVRLVRRVVTGALEIARAGKRIGSSLEADPIVHVSNAELREALLSVDLAEVCITSAATLADGEGPANAFRLPDVPGVAVVVNLAEGRKCRRSGNGKPCARPRSERLMQAPSRMFWGPLTALGLTAAAITSVLDQASKLWLLKVFGLADRGVVEVMPFVELVLTWNTGISYGWFQQEGPFGQGALLALK